MLGFEIKNLIFSIEKGTFLALSMFEALERKLGLELGGLD